jgi:hypothetical protein
MFSLVCGKAVTVLSDRSVGLDDHTVADPAAVIDHSVGIEDAVVSNGDIGADEYAGIDLAIVADDSIVVDRCVRMDVAVLTDFCRTGNNCLRTNPHDGVFAVAVQQHNRLHKGIIRIVSDDLDSIRFDLL